MRTRFRSGFWYALAAIPVLGAGIVGPDLFHLSQSQKEDAFIICVVAAIACIFFGAVRETIDEEKLAKRGHRRRMIAIYGMMVTGLSFIGFAGAYFWPNAPAPRQNAAVSESSSSPSHANEPVTLFLQCDPTELPTSLPDSGRVFAVELAWNPNVPQQGGQNREMYGAAGLPLKWFDDSDFRSPYACQLINYGTAPIFNVFLRFDVIFYTYNAVMGRGPILGHARPIVSKAKTDIKISRLDIGPQNQFVFYIYNQSPYNVELSLPKVAMVGADDFGNGGQPEAVTTRAGTHKRDSQRRAGMIQGLRKEPSLGTRIFLANERPVRPAQAASAAGYAGQASGR